jgi:hypothetical protein
MDIQRAMTLKSFILGDQEPPVEVEQKQWTFARLESQVVALGYGPRCINCWSTEHWH